LRTFELEKWYFDAVNPEGRAWIGYSARLSWLGFRLYYNQSLCLEEDQKISLKTSFRRYESPQNTKLFSLSAEAKQQGFAERLHDDSQGHVDWYCVQPMTDIRIRRSNAGDFIGKGYIEKLSMTIKPWQLPIDTLIWGRFIGQKHSAVWIHWEHSNKQSWLFINSKKQAQAIITNSHIRTQDWDLSIENKNTLINSKPFMEHTRLVGMLLPSSMRHLKEQKWLARGHLKVAGEEDIGWVIHERVNFKAA
jgi:hypothetical protein